MIALMCRVTADMQFDTVSQNRVIRHIEGYIGPIYCPALLLQANVRRPKEINIVIK